jgi:hypothetical protein
MIFQGLEVHKARMCKKQATMGYGGKPFSCSLREASTRSVLILWVEAFASKTCIIGGTWPVHPGLFGLAFVLPRLRVLS